VIGYGLDDWALIPDRGMKLFHHHYIQSSFLFNSYKGLFPWGIKQLKHEADHFHTVLRFKMYAALLPHLSSMAFI
jgi:hypothetical protein